MKYLFASTSEIKRFIRHEDVAFDRWLYHLEQAQAEWPDDVLEEDMNDVPDEFRLAIQLILEDKPTSMDAKSAQITELEKNHGALIRSKKTYSDGLGWLDLVLVRHDEVLMSHMMFHYLKNGTPIPEDVLKIIEKHLVECEGELKEAILGPEFNAHMVCREIARRDLIAVMTEVLFKTGRHPGLIEVNATVIE